MMKEYRYAAGWRIFFYLSAAPMAALFGWAGWLGIQRLEQSAMTGWILITVSGGFIALFLWGIVEFHLGKLILEETGIRHLTAGGERVMQFDEVAGYRLNEHYLILIPEDGLKKKIRISTYMSDFNSIHEFVSTRIVNLDQVEKDTELDTFLSVDDTPESRMALFERSKNIARVYNLLGAGAAGWAIFFPRPYALASTVLVIFPLVGFVVVAFSRGAIKLDEQRNSSFPHVAYGLLLSCVGCAVRGFDYDIYGNADIWIPLVAITLTTLILSVLISKTKFDKWIDYVMLLPWMLILGAYSFGTCILINCNYDSSAVGTFETTVVEKEMSSSGSGQSYYLRLSPWGDATRATKATVSKVDFDTSVVGRKVQAHLEKGSMGIFWYYVSFE